MAAALTPREMLARLVAFPTVSTRSNLDLIGFVEDYLAGLGVASFRDARRHRRQGRRSSRSSAPRPRAASCSPATPTWCRSTGQAWTADPFTLDRARRPAPRPRHLRHEGLPRLRPRRSCRRCWPPACARPIILALTRDEEIGCIGAPPLIERDARRPAPPRGGHRRRAVGDARRHRPEGQLGLPRPRPRPRGAFEPACHTGVSAVMEAAGMIDWMRRTMEENARADARRTTSTRPTPPSTSA